MRQKKRGGENDTEYRLIGTLSFIPLPGHGRGLTTDRYLLLGQMISIGDLYKVQHLEE